MDTGFGVSKQNKNALEEYTDSEDS